MRMLIISIILLSVGVVYAAPTVTGVSGTVAKGQTITVSGSAFGSNGPTVRLFDSFEKGMLNGKISTSAGSADVANWSSSDISVYSNEYSLSGSRSMKVNFGLSGLIYSQAILRFPNVQNSDILVSWWQYMPTNCNVPGAGPGAEGANWKWYWIGDENDDWPWGSDYCSTCMSNNNCSNMIGMGPMNDQATPRRYDGEYYVPNFAKGTWMRFTFAMKNATSGAYVWNQEISSVKHHTPFNVTGVVTAHADDPWNALALPGYGRDDVTAVVYYDDVYVATGDGARARVEIGESSTYTNCRKLAILPTTAWSNTQATAVLHSTGQFVADDQVYLFVVDSSGGVSPGYGPLTIGSSGGGDPPDPDTTNPSVLISTQAQTITGSSLTVTGSASDNDAVSSCRWQLGSVPTISTGSTCTGTTSFSCATSGYAVGANTVHVACFDPSGNRGSDSVVITRAAADTTPPTLSGGQPSGTLPAGTTSTTVSLTTDEDATCRWMPTSGTAYASMTNTFGSTGTTGHSETVSGLTNGSTYNRYVRCIDGSGNANTTDYHISWSVAEPIPPVDVISIGTVPIPYVGN